MSRELTVEEKGLYAKELKNNPVFVEIMRACENDFIRDWGNTNPEDKEVRETFWQQIRVLKKVEEVLNRFMNEAVQQ